MKARMMEFMTVKEMRQALRKTKTVILPIGGTEQHGYHLPLSTDSINAYEIARRASEKTGCLVAPILNYSFSGGGLPGTTDISPQLTSLIAMEICNSLAQQGLKNIVILSGHGGSEHLQALDEAAKMFYRRYSQWKKIRLALLCFVDLSPLILKAFKEKDCHAGYFETSIIQYCRPELVKKKIFIDAPQLKKKFEKDPEGYKIKSQKSGIYKIGKKESLEEFIYPPIFPDPRFKIGVWGNPYKASPQLGKKMIDECVDGLTRLIKKGEKNEEEKGRSRF